MKRVRGISMIESLAAILIGSLITLYSIPSFVGVVDNYRVASYADSLTQHLSYARSEAIKRNVGVNICARATPTSLECGVVNNWSNGWLVYYNNPVGSAVVLRLQEALSAGSLVDFSASTLSFKRNGLLAGVPSSFNLSSSYCSGNNARNLQITQVGIVQQSKMSC